MSVRPTRRIVFQGLGALSVAAVLAGCSSGDSGGAGGDSGEAPEAGTELAAAEEVPVGGGVVISEEGLVLTQPAEGEFKAFTSTCTHQGGALSSVEDGEMICPLHNSHFAIEDGSPVSGPATEALAEIPIEVRDGAIFTA